MTAEPQAAPYPTDVNAFLMGSPDGPSAPFLKMGPAYFDRPQHTAPGEWKGGRIVALRAVQAYKLGPKDPTTNKPTRILSTYQSGRKAGQPIWDALVILQTNERDPLIEGDDGLRQIQLDGFDKYWEPSADADCRKRAARLAVVAAGATGLEVGAELYLAWTKQVPTGSMPATHWIARYVPQGQRFEFEQPEQAAPTQAQAFATPEGQRALAQAQPQAAPAFANYPPTPGQPTGPNGWGTPPPAQAPQHPATPQGQPLPAQPPF